MKPILIAVAFFASTFTKSFAANDPAVQPIVLKSFNTTFANATEVAWSLSQDFYKAQFYLNGQYVTAYYNTDGSIAMLARHIAATSLPMMLQTTLKANYKNQWITDVLEVTGENGLQYYVTVEDADTKVILKGYSTTWSMYQKSRKD